MSSGEADKLAELRARTDRQLIALIDSILDKGFRQACEEWPPARRAKAERAWREAVELLPAVYGLCAADRRRLETKMMAVRQILDGCCLSQAG